MALTLTVPTQATTSNQATSSLVDPSWELIDPTPDVRALFLQFDRDFFDGKLQGIEVRWSPRMTLCAGVCSYEGRGGLCSVRLSVPLLKLRPRKDLVETLLHEMIHAYLFVTANNRDREGHGPEFCSHMRRINSRAGTSISVYHSFHDEVKQYKQHKWTCDGVCRQRPPYFGQVSRSMNRAPGPNDPWHEEHKRTCGGTFHKVAEPENYGKPREKKTEKTSAKSSSSSDVATGKRKRKGVNEAGTEAAATSDLKPPAKSKSQGTISKQPTLDAFYGKGHRLGGDMKTDRQTDTTQSSSTHHSTTVSDSNQVTCPCCGVSISQQEINIHLDSNCGN